MWRALGVAAAAMYLALCDGDLRSSFQ